jgi:hypothetical protein
VQKPDPTGFANSSKSNLPGEQALIYAHVTKRSLWSNKLEEMLTTSACWISTGEVVLTLLFPQMMKTLLILFVALALPCFGGVSWSHRVTEGEGGGINANYFFYETFRPDYGDGTLMSVQRVRAIYVLKPEGDIVVIDYFLGGGIKVAEMRAKREDLLDLIAGKDVELKKIGEFSIETETSVGYLKPKNPTELTADQQERIFNLIHILSMQRSPIKANKP